MKNEEFEKRINSIQEKIGQDASNLILDEIGVLLTDNKEMNSQIAERDKKIEKLETDKETLQRVNGNLLQQVAMGDDPDTKPPSEKEKPKPFDFRSAFDEFRKF